MWMRIKTRSPLNPCMLLSFNSRSRRFAERQQPIRRGEPEERSGQREHDTRADIERCTAILTVVQHHRGFIAESRKGRVPAAEAARQEHSRFHAHHARLERVTHDESE